MQILFLDVHGLVDLTVAGLDLVIEHMHSHCKFSHDGGADTSSAISFLCLFLFDVVCFL